MASSNSSGPELSREEAIKVLEMFLYKQCSLGRTEFAYDADTVWEAVKMAAESLKTDEAYQLEYEPTTKNNLGVDCISREQALVAIRNLYPGMPRVDFNGSLRKWVDKYKPYIECDDAIKQLPPVTPQIEPRKGHWIKTPKAVMGEGYMWYCDKCKHQVYQDSSRPYPSEKHCPNCGAKMVEPQEGEVKE